jgi:small-conductance mechanosensitive channel
MSISEVFNYELFHINDFTFKVGSVILSIGTLVVNYFIIRIVAGIVLSRYRSKPNEYGRKSAVLQLLKYILWAIAIMLALRSLGIDLTFLIASSAALLVGLGLGMQIIFKDFMSGIILLLEGSIKVNDVVQIGDQVLKVRKIALRTSEVITRDDKILIVPNHKFTEENVINWTYNAAPTRFYIEIGVDYSSDIKLVETCLLQSVLNNPDILNTDDLKPFVRFINFGSSALEFQLIFWSYNLFRIEATKSTVRYEIARLFRANNITIPFTQVVIHQAAVNDDK